MLSVSQRTSSLGTEHAFVVLAEVNQLVANGRDIISFAIGQPDFPTPANICEAAKRALDSGKHGYTASAGIPELRAAVASYLSSSRGLDYHADHITVANGAKPFIMYSILAATDHGAGHEVLYPTPGFPIYESQIIASGAIPVALPLLEREAFSFDIDVLRQQLSSSSRLLILNSPHNPTGRSLRRAELEAIAAVLQGYPDCWVFSDEVYSQMVHDDEFVSIASLPGMRERTIVVDGASKSYAMTGWRLGYAANEKLAPHFSTWVTNTDSCAGSITQWAGVESLEGDQQEHRRMMESFKRRRDLIFERLNTLDGVSALKPGGAFYIWVDITDSGRSDMDFAMDLIDKRQVTVVPGSTFGPGNEGRIRISLATAPTDLYEGVSRLVEEIKS